MNNNDLKDLEERVQKFNSSSLPGQPLSIHVGTYYLVNELWREIQRLLSEIEKMKMEKGINDV